MPKFASTLASLLLIASSIGVNIARYPQVGRTVGSVPPADPAKSADSVPGANPADGIKAANPDSSSADPIACEPAKPSQAIADARAGGAKAIDLPPVASQALSGAQAVVPIVDVRPMLPVARLQAATSTAISPAGYDEVQRLPAVDPSVSATRVVQSTGSDDAKLYPTTATP